MHYCGGKKVIWLSGDSWLDWRSTIKSGVKYENSVEGQLINDGYKVISLARGGSSNHSQISLIEQYMHLTKNSPDIWIHAWTEVGRDLKSELVYTNMIDKKSRETALKMLKLEDMMNCSLLTFGGQSQIPEVAVKLFDYRIIHSDLKSHFLKTNDYGSSQFFSLICHGEKLHMTEDMINLEIDKSYRQLELLTESASFPDNAHLGINENFHLYKMIKEKLDDI